MRHSRVLTEIGIASDNGGYSCTESSPQDDSRAQSMPLLLKAKSNPMAKGCLIRENVQLLPLISALALFLDYHHVRAPIAIQVPANHPSAILLQGNIHQKGNIDEAALVIHE